MDYKSENKEQILPSDHKNCWNKENCRKIIWNTEYDFYKKIKLTDYNYYRHYVKEGEYFPIRIRKDGKNEEDLQD